MIMSRRILLTVIAVIAAVAAIGADNKAVITFGSTSYDFGVIRSTGGKVSATYTFTNTGNAPLLIVSVSNGGCGCTTPTYPKEPIMPGKKGTIVIHFDPTGRRGEFKRKVKVTTNAAGKRATLTFSGEIIP